MAVVHLRSATVIAAHRPLIASRLANQQLADASTHSAEDVVACLCAVQAQDYLGAKWALALRAPGLTDQAIDDAFNAGRILRTHILRPTWHLVCPSDLRWIMQISGPRVRAMSGSYLRSHDLDAKLLARTEGILSRALEGGRSLTRAELSAALKRHKVDAVGNRLALIVMHAELGALICSGPLRDRTFTYALTDERAPKAAAISNDEAIATLVTRYFASHGPATVRDFVWWSGLTTGDVKRGIAMAGSTLESRSVEGLTFYSMPARLPIRTPPRALHLLPNYDEYLIAYKDREPGVGRRRSEVLGPKPADRFSHHVVVDGELAGSWGRTIGPRGAVIEAAFYDAPSPVVRKHFDKAVDAFSAFLRKPVEGRVVA